MCTLSWPKQKKKMRRLGVLGIRSYEVIWNLEQLSEKMQYNIRLPHRKTRISKTPKIPFVVYKNIQKVLQCSIHYFLLNFSLDRIWAVTSQLSYGFDTNIGRFTRHLYRSASGIIPLQFFFSNRMLCLVESFQRSPDLGMLKHTS